MKSCVRGDILRVRGLAEGTRRLVSLPGAELGIGLD